MRLEDSSGHRHGVVAEAQSRRVGAPTAVTAFVAKKTRLSHKVLRYGCTMSSVDSRPECEYFANDLRFKAWWTRYRYDTSIRTFRVTPQTVQKYKEADGNPCMMLLSAMGVESIGNRPDIQLTDLCTFIRGPRTVRALAGTGPLGHSLAQRFASLLDEIPIPWS